jgi:hypothetical protein
VYERIRAQFSQADLEPITRVCKRAQDARLLGSDYSPLVQFTISQPICQILIAYLPLYQLSFPGKDFSSAEGLAQAREFIVNLIISGIFLSNQKKK